MLRPQAEQLISRALAKEHLNPAERRHCISYLQVTQPEATNVAMAEMFGVTEGSIRADIKAIRSAKAKIIREDDIGLVIADVALTFEHQVRDAERSKLKAGLGSRTYLEHCRAIARMQVERIEILQKLGYFPLNLGNMTVQKFEYKATVTEGTGRVETSAVAAPRAVARITDGSEPDEEPVDAEFEDPADD